MFYPLKFKPVYKDYIWGGRKLEKYKKDMPEGRVAESWEIAAHKDGMSVVINGQFSGMTLHELVQKHGRDIVGNELPESTLEKFPLLIKLIDANEKLSVQVHPHDEYALVNEGEQGKNEMWYIVEAKEGAQIIYDVSEGVTREQLREAIEKEEVSKCLQHVEVMKGDFINIPAGVIHAIGEGIILAEIQQNSNSTYRVYDYGRIGTDGKKRPLHIDKALDVINFNSHERTKKTDGIKVDLNESTYKIIKAVNKYFVVEVYEIDGSILENTKGDKFFIYVFVEGVGKIKYGNESMYVRAGQSVLVPAALGEFEIEGTLKALKTYVPNIEKDIVEPLMKLGYKKKEIYERVDIR